MSLPAFGRAKEPPGAREVSREYHETARKTLRCCPAPDGFLVHAWPPTQDWDPDYTVIECNSCGAVFTIGDVAAMHEFPPFGLLPSGSLFAHELVDSSPSRHPTPEVK